MIVIVTSWVEGSLGFHKSVVELANGLHRSGRSVSVIRVLAPDDGQERMIPRWPLDVDVPVYPLQTLAARGGTWLHKNLHPALSFALPHQFSVTANQLEALRELNAAMTEDDTIIFNHPMLASVFQQAIQGDARRVRTVLQVQEDYQYSKLPWDILMEARAVVDMIQTVSAGLRTQFLPHYDARDVVFVPNFPGTITQIERREHDGVRLVQIGSFDRRKNQKDAVKAVSLVRDASVHLALWGNSGNPYGAEVRALAKALEVEDRVAFPGYGSDKEIYAQADALVMTSVMEGLPYVLIDAAAHGLPIITYDFDFGPRDIVEDGDSGFIVPVGDFRALAERIDQLAADASLRERLGRRARRIFEERFSEPAVAGQYEALVGSLPGSRIDLAEFFATDGTEPLPPSAISHSARNVRGETEHTVTVRSLAALHDVRIDDGSSVREPLVKAENGATRIVFTSDRHEVVSYVTEPGSKDRHYLANVTAEGTLEVRPYLRRDAASLAGHGSGDDTIVAITGAGTVQRLTPAMLRKAASSVVRAGVDAVRWKYNQVRGTLKTGVAVRRGSSVVGFRSEVFDPWGDLHPAPAFTRTTDTDLISGRVTSGKAPAGAASPADPSQVSPPAAIVQTASPAHRSAVGRLLRSTAGAALGTARRARELKPLFMSMVRAAKADVAEQLSRPTVMGHRELDRHPWYPVTAGRDNFGVGINQPGGVTVTNSGTLLKPTVSITGEYDWLDLRSGPIKRRIQSPVTYGEFYERLCEAEAAHGLFDVTACGVHVWELGRSALVTDLSFALGFWNPITEYGERTKNEYHGQKKLADAPVGRRFIFDFMKRGQTDYRTAAFRDGSSVEMVFASPDGYPDVTPENLKYPLFEFTSWQQSRERMLRKRRVPDVDTRPFEEVLSRAFGINVDLSDHMRFRLLKFLDEREFFSRVFEKIRPSEVLIAQGHYWSGIAQAARDNGVLSSDIQYADTGRFHSTYWFGGRPHHGPHRFYAWSDFWAERTNVYAEHVVVPRIQPELEQAIDIAATIDPDWDVAVIGQPTVSRRMTAALVELARARPQAKIVYSRHPFERVETVVRRFEVAGVPSNVEIADTNTIDVTLRSRICLGAYSTSMWEAAAMGRPVYVLPVPGSELAAEDVASGLFRPYMGPEELLGFDVPESRKNIFTFGADPSTSGSTEEATA